MENNILNTIQNLTLEILVIAVVVFGLTMLIKIPIKKATAKLSEDRRKAINSVIILLPIILAFGISILYFGIRKKLWVTSEVIDTSISACVLSFTIFAVYQRIVILIKGIVSGKVKINSELTQDTINFLRDNLKALNSKLKVDEKALGKISKQISSLAQIKSILETECPEVNIAKLADTNIKIQALVNKEAELKQEMVQAKQTIQTYKNKLYINEGETL